MSDRSRDPNKEHARRVESPSGSDAVGQMGLTDLAYDDLDIQYGMAAVVKYGEMIASSSEQKQKTLRNQLLEYCERDTYAMVQIHRGLREMVG